MVTKDDDFVEHLYVATAHSYILVFTESGRVHWLKVHEIPEAGPAAQGQGDRQPAQPGAERAAGDDGRGARVPRRPLPGVRHRERHGEEDRARRPTPTRGSAASSASTSTRATACSPCARRTARRTSCFATAKGFSIRFPESDVRSMGRATYGVKGLVLRPGDRVVAMEELDPARPGAHRHRARLRQADAGRGLPPPGARRPRHHQPQGDAEDGRGGGGHAT